MLFSSSIFIFVFLPSVLLLYYLINPKYRNILLLMFSLVFYAWGEPVFVLVMLLSIFINYLFGILVARNNDRMKSIVLIGMVGFNLLYFFIFKYLNFVLENLNFIFNTLPKTNIALPIGISFFTFQAMSYVFDVANGNGRVQKNLLNVALYISFFPQLMAGPIIRYESIAAEIDLRHENSSDFSQGIRRFVIGLAKKVILSNSIAVIADYAFGAAELSVLLSWLGAISYTMQIYFDFSGYSDMAIGLGLMFGFHFKENFDYPYTSKSISEFWRRWHISLGSWFRDYVYFPLGGSRVDTKCKLLRNLFIVWVLTGIWHGANWTFILWGLYYFSLLAFEKLIDIPNRFKGTISQLLYQVFTIFCVVIGWVLFRSDTLSHCFIYLKSMFFLSDNSITDPFSVYLTKDILIVMLLCLFFSGSISKKLMIIAKSKFGEPYFSIVRDIGIIALLLISFSYIVNSHYDPFIYFNF